MAKNIVFCADGTWNGPGQVDGTAHATSNVFKLFLHLDGTDANSSILLAGEQERFARSPEGSVVQCAKYLHGVGDSNNLLVKLLGGSTGAGLITRIVRGYTFISRHWEPGDRIFLVGFSRGAYTARALGGLIASMGLLDATGIDLEDKDRAYRLGTQAWYRYRAKALTGSSGILGQLSSLALDLPGFVTSPIQGLAFTPDVPIEAIAVWDTVGALGIPAYELRTDQRIDALRFADTKLSAKVARGFHAIAIDERRSDFTPTLWEPDPRIVQVLFPGAHADVGGGYLDANGESGLSDCALLWMIKCLQSVGTLFAPRPDIAPRPDALGCAHTPWTDPPWNILPNGSRRFEPGLSLAQAVIDRLGAAKVRASPRHDPTIYDPSNLRVYLSNRTAAPGIAVLAG